MYKYTFIFDNGDKYNFRGNHSTQTVVDFYLLHSKRILTGEKIIEIIINTPKGPINVEQNLILKLEKSFIDKNKNLIKTKIKKLQEIKCKEMEKVCPEESKLEDPISLDNWCDEVTYKEFVKNDKYLSQCYRTSTLINSFVSGLEQAKNDIPFPQWPQDPFTRVKLSPQKIKEIYTQAIDSGLTIPEILHKFIQTIEVGLIDAVAGMKDPYDKDHINIEHVEKFINPLVNVLYPDRKKEQEDADLAFALQLAEEQ